MSKNEKRAVVVGCGGTGSEMIKLLLLCGYEILCIDYDKIEYSNICRQFYFTENDCTKYKAGTIATKTGITFINKRIQDVDSDILSNYNIIFSCVDSISARMDINMIFKSTACRILVDLGVENNQFHIKRVDADGSCLYCIKDLYKMDNGVNLCSLSSLSNEVTDENRNTMLKTAVFAGKEQGKTITEIVNVFNIKTNNEKTLTTDEFEVSGIYNNILPNSSVINSMCASYAMLLLDKIEVDFLNGDDNGIKVLKIERDENCFLCNNYSHVQ